MPLSASNSEQFQRELRAIDLTYLSNAYNHFREKYNGLMEGWEGANLGRLIDAGRGYFHNYLGEHEEELGIGMDGTRVFYGDWMPYGNAEGSLYTLFEGNILSIRWAGRRKITLNGEGNRFVIERDPQSPNIFNVKLDLLHAYKVLGLGEHGVVGMNIYDYHRYTSERDNYEWELERRAIWERRGMMKRAIDRVRRKRYTFTTLIGPLEPDHIEIPFEELASTVVLVREGMMRTLDLLSKVRESFLPQS